MTARILLGVVIAAAAAWAASRLLSDGAHTPDFAVFAQCPVENPVTTLCLITRSTGGELRVGAKTMPISSPITMQGGVDIVQNEEKEIMKDRFIPAKNGQTLSTTPQAIPGGLRAVVEERLLAAGLRKGYRELIDQGKGRVSATIELAVPASAIAINVGHLVEAEGTAVTLPIKVKLDNPFLGKHCYIGSNRDPISLRLTTGETDPPKPNQAIRGRVGKTKLKDDEDLTVIKASSLVNNAFAAPGVSGCGRRGSRAVDAAIDGRLGLPAPTGHNTIVLSGAVQEANAVAVRAGR
jgi:hypothetical protein